MSLDIDPIYAGLEEDQISIQIGDQSDKVFLKSIVDEFGPINIVLEDGSHVMSHIKASFDFLYPQVTRNGMYFVEDLHTAYWDEYTVGLRREGSFIEFCKNMIDQLNADFSRGALDPDDLGDRPYRCTFTTASVFSKNDAPPRKKRRKSESSRITIRILRLILFLDRRRTQFVHAPKRRGTVAKLCPTHLRTDLVK